MIGMKVLRSPQLPPAILEHAHHARELTLSGDSLNNEPQSVSRNINTLLDRLDAEKVTALTLKMCMFAAEESGPQSGIFQTMLRFPSLQKLHLSRTIETDCGSWKSSNFPKTLTQLSVYTCDVSEEFFQTILDSNPNISSLCVDQCNLVSSDILVKSKPRNLKSLSSSSYQYGVYTSRFDITLLGCLQKLENLELYSMRIKPSPLSDLWEGLTNIIKLDLHGLDISSQCFSGISVLLNLKELAVTSCRQITSNCFVTAVSLLEKLKFLRFDVELFEDVIEEDQLGGDLSITVAHLNKMPSLSMVKIYGNHTYHCSRILRCFVGEWKKWTVSLDYEWNYVLHKNKL